MAYEQKDMSGSLFRNNRKEKETHPDYQGSCKIDGVDYWISGWKKDGKDGGAAWMSFAFKKKEPREERQAEAAPARKSSLDDMPDDLPF